MKLNLLKILLLLLVVALTLGLAACGDGSGDGNTPDEGNTDDPNYFPEDDEPLDGLILIKKAEAKFTVVTASGAGSSAIRAANDFVARLRELGVTVGDVINDKDASKVTDCEIIVGTGAKNRPDGCSVNTDEFGPEGSVVKVVGNRVVIAGGTTSITRDKLNKFIEEKLGITSETETLRNVAVPLDLNELVLTEYDIDSISIAGTALSEYVISVNKNDFGAYPYVVNSIKNVLFNAAGYSVNVLDSAEVADTQKKILVRTVADAGDDGFKIYVDDGDMIIECSVESLFLETVEEFISANITSKKGNVEFASDFTYSKHIRTLKYADFGAMGDGKTNDFFAMNACHERANETGQTVAAEGKVGNKFYIGKTWEDDPSGNVADEDRTTGIQINVKTSVEFGDAEFIIDDTVSGIHYEQRRGRAIFSISSDRRGQTYSNDPESGNQLSTLGENLSVKAGATSIPWLDPILTDGDYFVLLKNSNHKDFIRYGVNADSGYDRMEVLIVDKDGNISASTPLTANFDKITEVMVRSLEDKPITISGGTFTTKSNKVASGKVAAYDAYQRGFRIARANVTITDVTHFITGEPSGNNTSYPYYGFINFYYAYNSTLKNSVLSGHKYYVDSKGVSMGTYDLTIEYSDAITIENVRQPEEATEPGHGQDIKDTSKWGLSASNGSRNLVFNKVTISRIDAHRGFWNLDIKDSVIGFALNVIGGGTLTVTNTQKRVGSEFINLRSDYGATFNGDVYIKNCTLNAYKDKSKTSVHPTAYVINATFPGTNHKFGYTCYMPRTLTIENFKCGAGATYVYNDISDAMFPTYKITEKITFKNTTRLTICPSAGCTKLRAIKTVTA